MVKAKHPTNVEFGRRLRQRRMELGFTQDELAEQLGVSRVRITQMEAGTGLPDRKKWPALARLLSVNPDWLIYGRGAERESGMDEEAELAMRAFRNLPPDKRQAVVSVIHALMEPEPDRGSKPRPMKRAKVS